MWRGLQEAAVIVLFRVLELGDEMIELQLGINPNAFACSLSLLPMLEAPPPLNAAAKFSLK